MNGTAYNKSVDAQWTRVDEEKRREEKKRTGGVENCLFGPLAAARHCKHPHHLFYSPTLFYRRQLPLSSGNCSPLSSSLLPNCVSPSPFFSSLDSVPFNSTPSGIDPQLEVITQAKKRHLAATHPRLSLHPVLLLCEKTSRYQTLLSLLKTYLSFSSRFVSFLAGLKLPRIVNM